MLDYSDALSKAVRQFWQVRRGQKKRQGGASGLKDAGERASVTGGKHADGFVRMIAAIVSDAALPKVDVHVTTKLRRTLPGFYRPCKEWDVVVLSGNSLVAVVEVKSQVGSFGNNFNNRVEEAVGNAADFWAAYREGAFSPSSRPWLGYLFMLESAEESRRPTRPVSLAPFALDEEFQLRSYADRYELACKRLVRDRLYDSACLILSDAESGRKGVFTEPCVELGIRNFAISLHARSAAFAKLGESVRVLETDVST